MGHDALLTVAKIFDPSISSLGKAAGQTSSVLPNLLV
jgi:hypothetical protein